ncbi:MAG TPA: hypothetical protein PLR86_10595, partial [Planctomycetota bacterium]|nr:hypothetical protein [Planctomycetota bacterium]
VKSSRIFFSKKLFELSEIIYSNNHPVWFEDFNITLVKPKKKPVTRGKQAAATPKILSQFNWQFNSVCLSNTVRQATSFYQDIKNNQNFMKDFIAIQIPRFTREEFDQQVGWRFTMGFIMAILQQEESSKTKK